MEAATTPLMACINTSLPCITSVTGNPVDQKAQVQMFLSAAMNNSAAGIRIGFQSQVFDINHSAYERHMATVRAVLEGV